MNDNPQIPPSLSPGKASPEKPGAIQEALSNWKEVLGSARVLVDPTEIAPYSANTIAVPRLIPAVLIPRDVADIQAIVKIANQYRVPLYPTSTGKNWGYGSSSPVRNQCAVLDLSQMNRIFDFDPDLGLVGIEPGVTQGQLHQFLKEQNAPFLVPIHGGGPQCSLMGNALERGYGITPKTDHFLAVNSLEAVLPTGQLYHSALHELGATQVDRSFKWGLGPYLDGLFTQSNFGIVTKMTLSLAFQPHQREVFFFRVTHEDQLEKSICAVRRVLTSHEGAIGSINLMNSHRVLSMIPEAQKYFQHPFLPPVVLDFLKKKHSVSDWNGAGVIFGSNPILKALKQQIRGILRPTGIKPIFVSYRSLQWARRVSRYLPPPFNPIDKMLEPITELYQIVSGHPSEYALGLSYLKSGKKPNRPTRYHPAQDGCGLIWYSPLVPMKPEQVREFVALVVRVCTQFGIHPLITLTSLSHHCFDSTIPLLFNRHNSREVKNAHQCYEALFWEGQKRGFLPYRLPIHFMDRVTQNQSGFWTLVSQIKKQLDPNHILSPGRYAPSQQPEENPSSVKEKNT